MEPPANLSYADTNDNEYVVIRDTNMPSVPYFRPMRSEQTWKNGHAFAGESKDDDDDLVIVPHMKRLTVSVPRHMSSARTRKSVFGKQTPKKPTKKLRYKKFRPMRGIIEGDETAFGGGRRRTRKQRRIHPRHKNKNSFIANTVRNKIIMQNRQPAFLTGRRYSP